MTKKQLAKWNIYSPYSLAKNIPLHVFIVYVYADRRNAKWQVCRTNAQTDPKGWWGDDGWKTFDVYSRKEKEPQRLAAIGWASSRFKIAEWERSPFGSYHPKGTLASATKTPPPLSEDDIESLNRR